MSKHWSYKLDDNGIGWLHFDHLDSSNNVFSNEALDELAAEISEIDKAAPRGLIFISDKKAGFIAGADVKGFVGRSDVDETEQFIKGVHSLFQRIEDLPFPTLALIHGHCLGGGLELALACRYRVARDDEGTRLSFPEVRLGIFPGFGGSVRSIELLGPLVAMQNMLNSRALTGRAAKKIGLVDQIAPERHLKQAAIDLITRQPPPHQPSFSQRLLNNNPLRSMLARYMEKETAKRVNREHYPAPFKLLDHWKLHGGSKAALYKSEARGVAELLTSSTAQNLIRVFFLQERMKSLGKGSDFKPHHVHVIGGGVMGGDIAAWCALRGMRVTLQDREAQYLSKAMQRAHALFRKKLKRTPLIQAAGDRLIPDHKGDGIEKADIIIEAIFESVEAKQVLFKEIEARAKPDAVLASNTSSIPLEQIATILKKPERLVGIHFFNPVAKMQLIEIVSSKQTSPDETHRAAAFALAINRLPLPVTSSPGFLVNRILMPYLLEAVALLEEGVPAPAIDRAALRFGMPMGPIALADSVGIDICLSVAQKLSETMDVTVPAILQKKVDDNNLGIKSGWGFYRYQKGKAVKTPIPSDYKAPEDLTNRMIFRLLNEAVACLREGVVEDADLLDAGVIFGTGFAPFRGGPMQYIRDSGVNQMRQRLEALNSAHGARFKADPGWSDLE
ncbi:MAG: 3-hydroxyacyl-CoA dehydrogenase NAD-binding domain-containing protein [Candidatus Polarisedimenticolaceae bacterium]|nr:3-hydroxyacyl-CoA dehydrogenase NAD-binding domain-containing protein [Candidatus Polarisedimenticolaceae bacterium]